MKKATLVNLFTIISLLILSVMTLIAIYATATDSSVLILDENFNSLDKSKWKLDISECKEDGKQYHYDIGKEENRLIADGVLLIQSNFTDMQFRQKRDTLDLCVPCVKLRNSSADCFTTIFQTRNVFNANCGRMEVRAKLRSENPIRFHIKITSNKNQNNSEVEKSSENFLKTATKATTNNSAEFEISFETASNKALIKRAITDDEFHNYEIYWDPEKISLSIDKEKVDERRLKLYDSKKENILNNTVKFNSTQNSEPFYLNVKVDLQRKKQTVSGNPMDEHKPDEGSVYYDLKDFKEESIFEMDYIRLFRILN